jgi:hypothetical protein
VGKAGILDGEIGVWLAVVTDAALPLAHLQYDLSTSRFGSRARGCWLGGEIGPAAGARRAAQARRPSFLFQNAFRADDFMDKLRYSLLRCTWQELADFTGRGQEESGLAGRVDQKRGGPPLVQSKSLRRGPVEGFSDQNISWCTINRERSEIDGATRPRGGPQGPPLVFGARLYLLKNLLSIPRPELNICAAALIVMSTGT